ncbi:ABC transporter permease [Bacteroidales bacterium OttesenSCG-928-B11]|nr:ABC transporter permease [Bacteroidales bacterium OttesenSCG-928-C03]MDL2312090.1 ABC transporter permease [Bacteroidales bacterium OttesenSCG-928-B11]MDL2326060.1 ABC transporter permease [Bacteroidales bacterium OttesenSCG-928-A14]
MKLILRNLLHIFRRYRLATILNILGLSVAFAAFIIIMTQVLYEWSYNDVHEDGDRIYRIEYHDEEWHPNLSRPLIELIGKSSPVIESFTFTDPWPSTPWFEIEKPEGNEYITPLFNRVTPSFFEIFNFEFIEGSPADLAVHRAAVVIPKSLADKYFDGSAMNKTIQKKGENAPFVIVGVYKDLPKNNTFQNAIYTAIPEEENATDLGNWNYVAYIRLHHKAENPEKVMREMLEQTDHELLEWDKEYWDEAIENSTFRLSCFEEIYFAPKIHSDWGQKGSKEMTGLLFLIACLIVIIAAINYTNFYTALSPLRAKNIVTQKVLGEEESKIRRSIMVEGVIIALFAFAFSLFIILVVQKTPIPDLLKSSLLLKEHLPLLFISGGIALLTGFFACMYPAFQMSSFPVALVLKGNFGLSPKGRRLRSVLLSIQFTVSIILLIMAIFTREQTSYMLNDNRGFDEERLFCYYINTNDEKRKAISQLLLDNPNIENVGFADAFIASDYYMEWGSEFKGENINHTTFLALPGFIETLGVELTEGRDFRESDRGTERGAYIFNETAKKAFNMELGDRVRGGEIVGFVKDFHFTSYRRPITPMCFAIFGTEEGGDNAYSALYFKMKNLEKREETYKYAQDVLAQFSPSPFIFIHSLKENAKWQYQDEKNTSALIFIFSFLSILISLVGVFGLIIFETGYRQKEIAVRKVFGANLRDILLIFNKTYIKLLLICSLIAVPVGYLLANRWLQNFAVHIPLKIWIGLFSVLIILCLTILTVTMQCWRTANENPAKTIKS